jgi:hypothetical protein
VFVLLFPFLEIIFQLLFESGINVVPELFDFLHSVGFVLEFGKLFSPEEEVGVLGHFGPDILGFFGEGH